MQGKMVGVSRAKSRLETRPTVPRARALAKEPPFKKTT